MDVRNPLEAVKAKSSIKTNELRTLIYGSMSKFEEIVAWQKKMEDNNLIIPTSLVELSRYDQMDYVIKYTQRYRKIMDVDYYTKNTPADFLTRPNFMIGGVGLVMVGIALDVMGTKEQRYYIFY